MDGGRPAPIVEAGGARRDLPDGGGVYGDNMDDENSSQDICRVCRCEGSADRPLFHPCICTGSIKYIHQECLLQWLRYSKKEFCELCNHRFSFTPIYSPDMPKRLPISIVFSGLLSTVARAVRFWLHYTVVALAWLGVVPLTACRIYRTLFTGSVSSILSLPLNLLSTENILSDILQGSLVVAVTLLAFIGLVWLREQIVHGGGPEWLDMEPEAGGAVGAAAAAAEGLVVPDMAAGAAVVPDLNRVIAQQQQQLPRLDEDDLVPAEPPPPPEVAAPPPPAGAAGPVALPAAPLAAPAAADDAGLGNNNNEGNNVGGGDNNQWNPMEWDRAAEDLTWEKLLGLDGSLVFIEHVFWVVSLNTLFILIFAFCPYHIGHFTIMGFELNSYLSGAEFEGMITTLFGYCVIGLSLVLLHLVTTFFKLKKSSRLFGVCYVVVKVSLLLVIEIIAFPVICGWWLDICSLSLFDVTLKDRQASYHQSPLTSLFIHWLVGMVYVFYFAAFVILLREVLRPGVLWFLRNLNDPDFNPIQEMIHLSIARHMRRFCVSLIMFGTSILVMLYLPSRLIKRFIPSFLPYQTSQSESQVDELALELILLLVILPAVQDQNHTKEWLKRLIRGWLTAAAWLLSLRSYLFGDVPLDNDDGDDSEDDEDDVEDSDEGAAADSDEAELDGGGRGGGDDVAVEGQAAAVLNAGAEDGLGRPQPRPAIAPDEDRGNGNNNNNNNLGAVHQALLLGEGPSGFQPYKRPKWFTIRIVGLLLLMLLSWLVAALVLMLLPVWLGRKAFAIWFSGDAKVYELYTAAWGTYACMLLIKGASQLSNWVQQGWAQVSAKLCEWTVILAKASVATVLLAVVIPLLFGFLLELVVLMPIRVPLTQSPIFFPWQSWAIGAMCTKFTIAMLFMGPDWWLKRATEQLYHDGLRRLDLGFLIPQLIVPAVSFLGLALAVPYAFAHGVVPVAVTDPELLIRVQRRIYPFLSILVIAVGVVVVQLKQFRKLYEHIKNDKYLVGRRLVNYNHKSTTTSSTTSSR